MNAPILVFDSGIGGLTVLRELRTAMPDRRFIYVADDAGFPYGDWEEEPLVARILDLFAELIDTYEPSLAVIACNTASTLVLPQLRARFAIPFVGTVPAIKPATERTRSGLVSVLATPGTVRRVYTRDLVEAFATHCEVRLVGSPELARLAERSLLDSEASGGQELDDAMAGGLSRPGRGDRPAGALPVQAGLGRTPRRFRPRPFHRRRTRLPDAPAGARLRSRSG